MRHLLSPCARAGLGKLDAATTAVETVAPLRNSRRPALPDILSDPPPCRLFIEETFYVWLLDASITHCANGIARRA
jgi:hypothetical protein